MATKQFTQTFNELQAAINAVPNKVDKVTGKGLSTNDYTTAEKSKLENIEAGAEENIIETVKVNGSALTPSSKAVDVTVPTKTSQLTNDSGFLTQHQDISGKQDKTDNNLSTTSKQVVGAINEVLGVANAKYAKPASGIPKSDMESAVQTSLDKADNAQPKENGKGLSEANYTYSEKVKLSAIESGAQVNKIEGLTINGSRAFIFNKIATCVVDVPTKTSELTNDSGFLTQHQDISGKVDKEQGKGLSTNDYTTAEKTKLSGIESGAEVNTIETIKRNGTALTPDASKAVNVVVPTDADDITYNGSAASHTAGSTAAKLAQLDEDKQDKTPVATPASASSYELAVDTLTNLGTLSTAVTFTLATAPSDGKAHSYDAIFTAGATAPTITWPSGMAWLGGNVPIINAGKTYEVSICNNMAVCGEFAVPNA